MALQHIRSENEFAIRGDTGGQVLTMALCGQMYVEDVPDAVDCAECHKRSEQSGLKPGLMRNLTTRPLGDDPERDAEVRRAWQA